MARLKLSLWDLVIADCEECLRLGPNNMKAHYYLAQAHLALRNFDDALAHALRAHQLCTDKSLESITQLVLRCKKDRWEDKERRRLREGSALESQMLELMGCRRDAELNEAHGRGDDQSDIRAEWEEKFEAIKAIFEKARAADDKKRVVPDWVVDDIGFGIMVDPVVVSCEGLWRDGSRAVY